jgi:hypothetical protein
MKEIIITMEDKNISVKPVTTNGDAIKNEKAATSEKKSWWERQSDGVQIVVSVTVGFCAFVGLCFVGGAVSGAIKESSARKTLNSEGFKEHDKLISKEYIARIERGLYDEPKTLEEAAARMLERSPQVIVHDSFYGTTDAVTSPSTSAAN